MCLDRFCWNLVVQKNIMLLSISKSHNNQWDEKHILSTGIKSRTENGQKIFVELLSVLWRLAQRRTYFTWNCKLISFCSFQVYFQIIVKYTIRDMHIMLLSVCEFNGSRRWEAIFFNWCNEITCTIVPFEILRVKKNLAKSTCCATQYAIYSLVIKYGCWMRF
jgi:hypothetical protein